MTRSDNPFRYFDSSPEVIRLVVMMYVKYPLWLCQVNFAEPRKPLPYAKIMPRRSQPPTLDGPRPGTGEGSVGGLGGAGD